MFNKIQKIFFIFLLGCLVIYPLFVLAEETSTQPEEPVELPNPLGTTDVTTIVARIIKVILGFVGVLALIMFIYGGLMWMTSGGKEEQIRKGKDTLVWAVAGMTLVFFSYAILNFILKILIEIKGE